MAIRSFSVSALRGLQRAEAHDLGNLVVVSGPNGAGKSSLLELLRQQRHALGEPGTRVLFVGPHRPWRSSHINQVSLYGFPLESFSALLSSDNYPQFPYGAPGGINQIQGQMREANNADEANAFVKTGLAKLGDRQSSLVTDTWTKQGHRIDPEDVPDLFEPFRQLVDTILPHLAWIKVDKTNKDNITCMFRPADDAEHPGFDIDQLSSGEKAALALLLPFVEEQVEQLVNPVTVKLDVVPVTMLLDGNHSGPEPVIFWRVGA